MRVGFWPGTVLARDRPRLEPSPDTTHTFGTLNLLLHVQQKVGLGWTRRACPPDVPGREGSGLGNAPPRWAASGMEGTPWVYPILFGVGAVAGFVDAIAGGGGLLTVPALLAAGLPPQLALGTNKLQSSCGTALASWNYVRAGILPWRNWLPGIAITFLSAVAGAATVHALDPAHLRRLIPFLLGAIAIHTALKPDLGVRIRPPLMSPMLFSVVFGVMLGFYDGFLGPGTGSFWMMACVLAMGLDLRGATGVTKAMNLTSNIASLAFFIAAAQVDYLIGGLMAAGQLIGAQMGSRMAIRHGARVIRPLFLVVVFALTARLAWDAVRSALVPE
jgi:uncharacterized membrane protein YfcA